MWNQREDGWIQELAKMIADLRQESYKQLQRIEALEEDSTEQAESNRFCTDAIVARIEALEKDGVAIRLNPGVTIQGPAILRTRIKSEQQPQQSKRDAVLDALRLAMPHDLFPQQPAPATEESSATAPPAPAGGLVERLSHLLAKQFSESRPGTDCTPFACDVLREVASWLRSDGPDWPSVASLLEKEANQ